MFLLLVYNKIAKQTNIQFTGEFNEHVQSLTVDWSGQYIWEIIQMISDKEGKSISLRCSGEDRKQL